MPGSFFDTNILVYIASGDTVKADRAEAAIAAGGATSVQVLNELTNVARRKMRMSWADTHALLTILRGLLTVHPLTIETHETGLALAERYGFSTYDAMIVASALHAGCDTLWSEDMRHGMILAEGLRIIDPFRAAFRCGAHDRHAGGQAQRHPPSQGFAMATVFDPAIGT
jgi:predicted nucleic acid-binding protein